MKHHPSQISPVGWYIASYIERLDSVEAFEREDPNHVPFGVWKNRILVKAHTPEEALERTWCHLADVGCDFTNVEGLNCRSAVVGITGLIPIYDPLEDGEEIEWIDCTGETVGEMMKKIRDPKQLEAFTIPASAGEDPDAGA